MWEKKTTKPSCSVKPSTNALTERKQQLKSMKSGLYLQRGTKETLESVFGLKGYSPQHRTRCTRYKPFSFLLRKEFKLPCHWLKKLLFSSWRQRHKTIVSKETNIKQSMDLPKHWKKKPEKLHLCSLSPLSKDPAHTQSHKQQLGTLTVNQSHGYSEKSLFAPLILGEIIIGSSAFK